MSSGPALVQSNQPSVRASEISQSPGQAALQADQMRTVDLPQTDRGVEFRVGDRLDPTKVATQLKDGIDRSVEIALRAIEEEVHAAAVRSTKEPLSAARAVLEPGARREIAVDAIRGSTMEPLSLNEQDSLLASLEAVLFSGDVTQTDQNLEMLRLARNEAPQDSPEATRAQNNFVLLSSGMRRAA